MAKTNKVYIMRKKEQFGKNAKQYAYDKRYLAEETVIERAYFRGCEFGFWDGAEETIHAVMQVYVQNKCKLPSDFEEIVREKLREL